MSKEDTVPKDGQQVFIGVPFTIAPPETTKIEELAIEEDLELAHLDLGQLGAVSVALLKSDSIPLIPNLTLDDTEYFFDPDANLLPPPVLFFSFKLNGQYLRSLINPGRLQVRLNYTDLTLLGDIDFDNLTLDDECVNGYVTAFSKPGDPKKRYFLEIDPQRPEEVAKIEFTLSRG